jgi:methanol metabolism-related c-type cytochrome
MPGSSLSKARGEHPVRVGGKRNFSLEPSVMNLRAFFWTFFAAVWLAMPAGVQAGPAVTSEDGKYFDAEENPTYRVGEDGTVDWFTYSGFRRYHSECHVCHGPDGLGSSFAPALADSMKDLGYGGFLEVVANGRERVSVSEQSKMPAFGVNRNVMCFIDDIYVYLMARADHAIGRGRPKKKEPKSNETRETEADCMAD